MRTTIEIPDSYRARLLELAARRGEKGFSSLVREALARYLSDVERAEAETDSAIEALGRLDDDSADALERSIVELRGRWRSP